MSDLMKIQQELSEIQKLKSKILAKSKLKDLFVHTVFILDYSGSMAGLLFGKEAHKHMEDALKNLQVTPEQCVSFHSYPFKGILRYCTGSTDLAEAFRFVKANYQYKRIMLISDGGPDSIKDALIEGRKLNVPIDITYIGEKGGYGERFMEQLAKETFGQTITTEGTTELLEEKITYLLTGGN